MNKQFLLRIISLVTICTLCCCAANKPGGGTAASTSELGSGAEGQKMSIVELKKLYETANSEYERRAVCLRAIDEGTISRGCHVSVLDTIFGTHFADHLPTPKELKWLGAIDFVPFVPSTDNSVAAGHVGWYLSIEYDYQGNLMNYYLTNLHK